MDWKVLAAVVVIVAGMSQIVHHGHKKTKYRTETIKHFPMEGSEYDCGILNMLADEHLYKDGFKKFDHDSLDIFLNEVRRMGPTTLRLTSQMARLQYMHGRKKSAVKMLSDIIWTEGGSSQRKKELLFDGRDEVYASLLLLAMEKLDESDEVPAIEEALKALAVGKYRSDDEETVNYYGIAAAAVYVAEGCDATLEFVKTVRDTKSVTWEVKDYLKVVASALKKHRAELDNYDAVLRSLVCYAPMYNYDLSKSENKVAAKDFYRHRKAMQETFPIFWAE